MSKKEMYNELVEGLNGIFEATKVKADAQDAILDFVGLYFKPKRAGRQMDIEEVTQTDADGNITHILCSVCEKFLPATEEFFYTAKDGGINGLKRVSKAAYSIKAKFAKMVAESERAIMQDVVNGVKTPEEGKELLAKLAEQAPDYSEIG